MTLLELLVAMTLLAALGGFIVQLLKNSFDLYHAGEKRGEYGVNSTVVLSLLEDDLANVAHGPDGRFLLERKRLADTSLHADPFLRFVRTVPSGDLEHRFLRLAGTKSKPERRLVRARARAREPRHAQARLGADGGLLRAPAGARRRRGRAHALPRRAHAGPRAGRVLRASGRRRRLDLRRRLGAEEPESRSRPASSRSTSSAGDRRRRDWERATSGARKPLERVRAGGTARAGILDGTAFSLAVGPASHLRHRATTSIPSRVRIALTLARPGRPDARLSRRLAPADDMIAVTRSTSFRARATTNQTIMTSAASASNRQARVRARRRSSGAALKPGMEGFILSAGTPVYVGKRFERTINLPDPRPSYDGVGK